MKKVLFVFSLILISLSSCKNDDTPSTYTQSMLNGTWENIVKTDGITNQLIITANSISEKAISDMGTISVPYSNYSFDGKKISYTYVSITDELTINELSSTKLIITSKLSGDRSEYKKIN